MARQRPAGLYPDPPRGSGTQPLAGLGLAVTIPATRYGLWSPRLRGGVVDGRSPRKSEVAGAPF